MSELPPLPYTEAQTRRGFGSGGGRQKGSPQSKVTLALKEAILLAAEEVGSDGDGEGGLAGYLKNVAKEDMKSFCGLLGKVLPMQITGNGGGPLEVTFRTVYEEASSKPAS